MSAAVRLRLALGLLLVGGVLLVVGFTRGEADVVMRKAVYICMECIGLG